MMDTATGFIRVEDPVPAEEIEKIRNLGNNALIIRLMFTVNHLSRWLTPIHDDDKLDRAVYRGEPTVRELVVRMREYDRFIYPRMYLAAHKPGADFDVLEEPGLTPARQEHDRRDPVVVLLSEFRRTRQTITALLRTLPDDAWDLRGRSRRGVEGTIRSMAEALAMHDYRALRALDQTLDQTGAREGLAEIQKVHLDELLRLVPDQVNLGA
jgi:hypothetical protein